MSTQTLTWLVAAVAAPLALVGAWVWRSMFTATRGPRIARYPAPRRALLVLDLQEGYVGTARRQPVTQAPGGGYFGTVNHLIAAFVAAGDEVAYVRQVFASDLVVRLHGGRRAGRVIVDRRVALVNDHDFEKNRTDAFSSAGLERMLVDRQVDHVFLVGVDAAYCVHYTALGALNRGYRVSVVVDAVRSRHGMARVLARYRRAGVGVVTSQALLDEAVAAAGRPAPGPGGGAGGP